MEKLEEESIELLPKGLLDSAGTQSRDYLQEDKFVMVDSSSSDTDDKEDDEEGTLTGESHTLLDHRGNGDTSNDDHDYLNGSIDRADSVSLEEMGRRYSPRSGSDGDVETDPNMDFSSEKGKVLNSNRFSSSATSSMESLDNEQTDGRAADDAKTSSTISNNNEVPANTLSIQGNGDMFNIISSSTAGHCTFIPGHDGAPSSESSAGFSCDHNSPNIRDTDSDNNPQRVGMGDYHTGNFSRPVIHPRPMHISESFSPACLYCHDNQSQMLPQHTHHSHQGNCCGSLVHTPTSHSHYHQNIPHNMSRSQTNSKYQSGSYEPPWDLVYPSFSQLGVLQQHHNGGGVPHGNMVAHDNVCAHNSASTSSTTPLLNQQSPYRASNSLVTRSMSSQDRLAMSHNHGSHQHLHQPPRANNSGINTLATTTGSHSYETPWDLGDRHIPPPSSPPPPPPESLRRPMVHYDGAALAQANFVQHLPQKKPTRRRCSWKCISIFLMLALVILAGCVAAFTYLLVEKDNSSNSASLNGANMWSGPVTDGHVGDRHRSDVPSYDFVKVRFYIAKSQFYKFNVSLHSDAIIGVYGRRSRQPTHTQYGFIEAVDGQLIASATAKGRRRRSTGTEESLTSPKEVNTAFTQYLEEGYWYVSFYNDGKRTQGIRFAVNRHDKMETDCPNDCYGKGDCQGGVCKCYPGYRGAECNLFSCPVLCSGNGVYEAGVCKCFDSWKGAECSVQAHHCEKCTNGRCLDGQCSCEKGWKGSSCSEIDCPVSDCSKHGICHSGNCYCEMGYRGVDCSVNEMKNFTIACSNDCSGHGTFDLQLQTCQCDSGWHGRQCENKECSVECINGRCGSDGRCVCKAMWGGPVCSDKLCDRRCSLHGECNNGTCTCQPGWNGRHCTLDGCPSDCHSNGACVKIEGVYSCSCQTGWKSKACDVQAELNCDDSIDNDKDSLFDCLDPDCCSAAACRKAAFCQTAPEPTAILQTKPKLSSMASFYDSKRFLIEGDSLEDSVQRVSDVSTFDRKRVSVIRGTVLLRDGSPAIGTRVEVAGKLEHSGFTLTRQNGTFDIMVNGGGSVTVRFIRGSARAATATVIVAWNTLVTLDPVRILQPGDQPLAAPVCKPNHDRYQLYPIVLPTWQHTQLRACPDKSSIIPESQVAQESISIPGTDVHLLYRTSDTAGYRSTVLIQLTPSVIPDTLALVHLKVSVEGVVHSEVFEADPSLTYRYSWQRQNAYQQNVYGIVTAQVSVGYQYTGCERIFWDKQATTLSGFLGGDLSSSGRSVAKGWSLDVQHFYNYQEGILHKGDGTNVYLKEKPRLLHTVLGNGSRRDNECTSCNGAAPNKTLLAPVAVASDLDGAVYVADYNMIRRLSPSMDSVTSVLKLNRPSMSYRYYMTVSPTNGMIYLTDFQNKQVLRVKETNPRKLPSDLATNFEVIAGTGKRCVRGSGTKCGDGGSAKLATLTNPKDIAVNKLGEVYFVDDTTIRKIRTDGTIITVIGTQDLPGQYVAMPCGRAADLYEVFLGWPTSISFSPVDDTLHILDSITNLILKVTPENKVAIVAGRPSHCPEVFYKKAGLGLLGDNYLQSLQARNNDLLAVKAMTFAPNGDLYIVESDEQRINRVRVVSTDGYISHYAGAKPDCNCQMPSCKCWDPDEPTAAKALLNNPSSLTVTPNGILYIADMGNLRVHSVVSVLPKYKNLRYDVMSAEDGQIYKFDRNGFHLRTIDMMTRTVMYNFKMYPMNSLNGYLVGMSGRGGHEIKFNRNQEFKVKNITVNDVLSGKLRVNENNELQRFTSSDGTTTNYNYALSSGLLKNKQSTRGEVYFFDYDDTGRLSEVKLPTGEITQLQASVDNKGAKITLVQNGAVAGTATYNGNSLSLLHGSQSADVTYSNDGSIVVEYPNGMIVTLETGSPPNLLGENPTALKRKIISSADGPVHRLEWRYYIRRQDSFRVGRKLRVRSTGGTPLYNSKVLKVNGNNLLSMEYLDGVNLEVIRTGRSSGLMHIIYNPAGQPTFLAGHGTTLGFKAVNITYNSAGQMTVWKQGSYGERRAYNNKGLLESIKVASDVITTYSYRNSDSQPTSVTLPSGQTYQIKYDSLGNLATLIVPIGQKHTFQRSMNLGFTRHGYSVGGKLYIEDYQASGNLVQQIYPSEYRRVNRRFATDGRPTEILYDTNRVLYTYNSATHALTSIELNADHYDCTLGYRSNGSLYNSHLVSLKSKLKHIQFADTQLSYTYNRFLRIVKISGVLLDGSRSVSFSTDYDYDESSGRLSGIEDFTVTRALVSYRPVFTLSDSKLRVSRRYDVTNLLSLVELRKGNDVIYRSSFKYDTLRRISEWGLLVGGSMKTASYQYDADSKVTKVVTHGAKIYEYTYNSQGSLTVIKDTEHVQSLTVDAYERATKYKGTELEHDQDGFLIRKGSVKYQFNSQGQLTNVLESGRLDVSYYYDAIGRLMMSKDNYGSTLQLVYANVMNPTRLTHVYNFTSHTLYSLLYDDQGHLLAIDNSLSSSRHYVMCDHSGSPTAVFDAGGNLLKKVERTVFGEVIVDSQTSLNVFIGYQGGFYDPVTKLVHLRERWYDPTLGRWMDSRLPGIFDRVKAIIQDPVIVNGYQYLRPINLHHDDRDAMYMKDMNSWLQALGYDLDVLAPRMTFEGRVLQHGATSLAEHALLPLVSAFQCAYEQDMDNFLELSMVPRSKLLPPVVDRSRRSLSPSGTLFSRGIVMSIAKDRLRANVYGSTPSQETLLATKVLDGVFVLGLNYTAGGKVTHYMFKPQLSSLDDDLKTMGMQVSSNLHLARGVRVRVTKSRYRDPATGVEAPQGELTVTGNTTVISVRYGTSATQETSRVLALAQQRAVEYAWLRELQIVNTGRKSRYTWTSAEINQLKHKGKVSGYKAGLYRVALLYPELADDPSNVRFVKA